MNEFMNILFDWCNSGDGGISKIASLIGTIVNIVRFIVPIGLVVMTTIDIFKKVINPDEKDGQKKILTRIISGLIVFFVPLMMRFIITLADQGVESGGSKVDSSSLECFKKLLGE